MSATSFRLDSACLPVHRLEAFQQTILDGIQDLLLVLAPDGRVLHASQTCFALTTLTPQHLIGNYIAAFMHHDDMPLFLVEFEASMSAGTPWRLHHRLRRADGTFAVFESTLNPFFDVTSTEPAEYFGLHKCIMTLRPYSNPSTVLMDSYLDHITTNTRLVEQIRQLRSEAAIADEEDNQELLQETSCNVSAANSIRALLDLTDLSQDPPQTGTRPSFERAPTKSSPQKCHGPQPCSL